MFFGLPLIGLYKAFAKSVSNSYFNSAMQTDDSEASTIF